MPKFTRSEYGPVGKIVRRAIFCEREIVFCSTRKKLGTRIPLQEKKSPAPPPLNRTLPGH